ncbi:hypothetical protein PRIC1_013670 [Phytophthora ramorum]
MMPLSMSTTNPVATLKLAPLPSKARTLSRRMLTMARMHFSRLCSQRLDSPVAASTPKPLSWYGEGAALASEAPPPQGLSMGSSCCSSMTLEGGMTGGTARMMGS